MQFELRLEPNICWENLIQVHSYGKGCKPKAIDIFSGPGGLSLGFKLAGYKIGVAVEMNANAAETYRKNHPDTVVLEKSAVNVSADEIVEICGMPEIVIGGPPCQGFSWANTQTRNTQHPGSAVSWHFVRLVEEINPNVFVMENVIGFMRIDGGKVFEEFKSRFQKAGYYVQHLRLNSENFGVPQKRDRVFLIGTRNKFEIKLSAIWSKHTVYDAISDLPPILEGEGGAVMVEYGGPTQSEYQEWARKESEKVYNHVTTQSKKYMIERFRHIPQGGNWRSIPEELMLNYADLSNVHSLIYRRLKWHEVAPTVTNVRKSVTIHPRDHRIISVREAARLQSFPDTYRFSGGLMHIQQQVADAVPPLLAKAVGECIYLALEG
jgi:DNA (cytosine-5)-methyltransferase 1